MTRLEAEFVRREAPPSYGQLIAQGLIPPVEDFPVYSASQVSRRASDRPPCPAPATRPARPQRTRGAGRPRGRVRQRAAGLVLGLREVGDEASAG